MNDAADSGRPRRTGRRRVAVVTIGAVTVGAVTAGILAVTGVIPLGGHRAVARASTGEVHTAAVIRTDLSDTREFAGSLGYGAEQSLRGRTPGTVTWLPAAGAEIDRGQPLYRVDERPVTLFFGTTPLYRKLDKPGLTGADVAVLKANLTALGHGAGDGAADAFTAGTMEAVKRWQRATNQQPTGVVDAGDAVVLPGPVRVAALRTPLAGAADGELMSLTGTAKAVTVAMDEAQLDTVKAGDRVTVRVPTGAQVPGTVRAVGEAAGSGGPDAGGPNAPDDPAGGSTGQAKVAVTVVADDPAAVKSVPAGPVQVQFVSATRKAVLAVPLTALLALSEGGYAVEVRAGAKRTLVAVQTGLFAKGLVEVGGPGLAEGQQVVVTS